jgi:hypothetical protein
MLIVQPQVEVLDVEPADVSGLEQHPVTQPVQLNVLTRAGADHGEHLRHVRSRGRAGQGPGNLDGVDPVCRIGCQQVMAARPAAE